jgi:hypothetical protein
MKIIRASYFIVLRIGCGGYEEGYLLAKPNNSESFNVVFLMGSRLLLKMGTSKSGDPVVEYGEI